MIIIIIIILIFIYIYNNSCEYFTDDIFIKEVDLYHYLIDNTDNYYCNSHWRSALKMIHYEEKQKI
jgi:hypothetical protein